MSKDPVLTTYNISSIQEAIDHVFKIFSGMGFKPQGSFFTTEGQAVLKMKEGREEKWFYTLLAPVPFFRYGSDFDISHLERLAKDPRLEEILFVQANGKVFSCTVQDMVLFGRAGSGEPSVCISIHAVKDLRKYTEYPQLPDLKKE